ncbi:hypothetical protein E2562_038983 [Oryza meyeriana var. granulata]|uniref:VQ domain-containing protein n=1 Tax=Oryza meyeriana var. granulata TaxID=110450 RepID=A0A6G1FGS4_9ORYZ|nr:hypothetical protein E2562_038983 [Oryza meyeriana var. granulata]
MRAVSLSARGSRGRFPFSHVLRATARLPVACDMRRCRVLALARLYNELGVGPMDGTSTHDLNSPLPPTSTLARAAAPAVASENAVVLPLGAAQSSSSSLSAWCRLGPAGGGRVGKRRPRPSKRAPTTYISTDTATFRLMVQQVTGAQVEPQDDACLGLLVPPPFDVVEPALLPADTSACAGAAHVAAYIPHPLHAAATTVEVATP